MKSYNVQEAMTGYVWVMTGTGGECKMWHGIIKWIVIYIVSKQIICFV